VLCSAEEMACRVGRGCCLRGKNPWCDQEAEELRLRHEDEGGAGATLSAHRGHARRRGALLDTEGPTPGGASKRDTRPSGHEPYPTGVAPSVFTGEGGAGTRLGGDARLIHRSRKGAGTWDCARDGWGPPGPPLNSSRFPPAPGRCS
jgi:hypothetical protein